MVNQALFARRTGGLPAADAVTHAGGPAYAMAPKQALAQLAMTGCLSSTYYADARAQLDEILARCFDVGGAYVARTALHARRHGFMKDTPALLCAWLASFDGEHCERVFDRVIDTGHMLRSFVQILRSGAVARYSLGSRPKRLVQRWLQNATDAQLIGAMAGQSPSLADVIRMVHPKAATPERAALFGYIIGRDVQIELLPDALQAFERFKADANAPVPELPFLMLTALPLTQRHWSAIARGMSWTATRMNLNTLQRHGVFNDPAMVRLVAKRLADRELVKRARVFPYQLLAANQAAADVPGEIRDALATALEHATANVPALRGSVAVAVDVSGSMESAVSGYRKGATSKVRCVDVAGLVAACVLARNPDALVMPFNDRVRPWTANGRGVWGTTQSLASMLGGGTSVSAPLAELNQRRCAPDVVIVVSDNQSWIDARSAGATATMQQWNMLKAHNPDAKLICIDLQPYTHTQAAERSDVLNVGGFSDAVFELVSAFAAGTLQPGHWVERIERIDV